MQEMALPALRAEFGRVAANSNLVPLRTISMVGAYPGEEGLPDAQDGFRLAKTLRLLRHCNIPLHPEFEVDVVNIHPAHGGRDFLKETKPADVIVLCFLFNPPSHPELYMEEPQHVGIHAISTHHLSATAWHDSAVRVGAKIITVFGNDGDTEVGPGVFKPDKNDSAFVRLVHPGTARHDCFDPHVLRHRQYI